MTQSALAEVKICAECGAECAASAQKCWMCHADVSKAETIVQAEVVTKNQIARRANLVSEWFFAISTILLLGVALLVGIGLALEEPGSAIVYAIIASPALIATFVRGRRRKRETGTVSWAERFAMLVLSGAITASVLVLLGAACLVGLFVYCVTAL